MVKKVKGYLAVTDKDKNISVLEQFKGEVMDKLITFPKGLGAEHPFDFKKVEDVTKSVGFVSGGVNKITDSIIGDFSIKADNKNSQAILDDFFDTTNFLTAIRSWIAEGVSKGNGFMELDLDNTKIRVMNANNMFVKRNKKGKVLQYNQWVGQMKNFSKDSKDLIPFNPEKIAHLPINKIPNDPYGIGFVWPNMKLIDNMLGLEIDVHKLVSRKAGAPIHVKVGQPGEAVNSADVDAFKDKLNFLNNRTEWVTDANVDMNVLTFSDLGKNLTDLLDHDIEQFAIGMEIPLVLLGKANIPEGLAKAQSEVFQRKIEAIRIQVEDIIEERILRPLLNANDLDEKIEFIWNLPGEEEINKRVEQIQKLLNTFGISTNMMRALELELARILEFKELENILEKPEKGLEDKEREEEETEIEQPEVPGAKPAANQKNENLQGKNTAHNCIHLTEKQSGEMTIREFINIKEIDGFNYSDYLVSILKRLRIDKFEELAAISDQDLANGLLSKRDVKKLRLVLTDGFKRNSTIRQIEKEIDQTINLKDRLKDGKTIVSANRRPNMIARTETVRLANEGLKDLYKDNGIDKVRFLAALSERTCPICEGLNGQVFDLNELQVGINQPPLHSNCRCSMISVVE